MDPWTQIFIARRGISVTPESTPLIRALSMGCYEVADQMAADGMSMDEPYRDERIRSPLHWSIQARDDLALEWLMKRITELDQVDYNGDTPLYESVIFGNRPAFTRLLRRGSAETSAYCIREITDASGLGSSGWELVAECFGSR